jgi:hypothetical protein
VRRSRRQCGSRTVANDLRIAAARKPDDIDFVGNSKISSFPQNPHPTTPSWYVYTLATRDLPARRVELADGALGAAQCAVLIAPYGLRDAFRCQRVSNSRALPRFPANETGIFVSQTKISPSEQGI